MIQAFWKLCDGPQFPFTWQDRGLSLPRGNSLLTVGSCDADWSIPMREICIKVGRVVCVFPYASRSLKLFNILDRMPCRNGVKWLLRWTSWSLPLASARSTCFCAHTSTCAHTQIVDSSDALVPLFYFTYFSLRFQFYLILFCWNERHCWSCTIRNTPPICGHECSTHIQYQWGMWKPLLDAFRTALIVWFSSLFFLFHLWLRWRW